MKVLILHQHFNTPQKGGAIRSYYLAKALISEGMKVIVITAHNQNQYRNENVEGIDVHYLPVSYDNRFGFYKRSSSFLRYVAGAVKLASKFNDVDLCYAISAPLTVGIAALRIKRKFSVPYFFEVGDLWPDAPIDMGIIKNSLLKQSLYTLEKRIYRHSKAVVALSPPIRAAIEKKIPGKKTHLVPNMADTEYYKPGPKDAALEKKFGVEGKFVVSYIGALGVANGLDYFLECARVSQRVGQPVHFLICGDGAMLDGLTESVKRLQLKNLTILPFQNRDGVRDIMNVTDAAFTCYKPVRILETGSPNKYFDGLAAGKLIVINFSGWIKEEIEQERCGVFIDPKQPTDFAQKIEAFLKNTDLLRQYQQAARSLAERKYSRKILGQTFARAVADWKSL